MHLPELRLSTNRSVLPKESIYGNPLQWLTDPYVSVDFFINWKTKTLGRRELWQKIIMENNDTLNPFNVSDILPKVSELINLSLVDILCCFGFTYHLMFIFDCQAWTQEKSIYEWYCQNGDWYFRINTVKEIEDRIIRNGGNDKRYLGNKGLTYSTSNLEYYLSKTGSLWPGDIDALVFKSNKPRYILEIRKNNRSCKCDSLLMYYHKYDKRKYDSLQFFADFLYVPIIVLAYPTQPCINEILLEQFHEGKVINRLRVSMQDNMSALIKSSVNSLLH